MAIELLCRKVGMTRIFTEGGESIAVTVLEAGPNPVVQKKTEETDGYTALQLGFGERSKKNVGKPVLGHFAQPVGRTRIASRSERALIEPLDRGPVVRLFRQDQ